MLKKSLIAAAAFVVAHANAATIGVGANGWYTDTLRQNLIAEGHTVTVFNSYNAATLAGLDAYIQDGNSFFDGNLLDSFVFNGGTLIEIPWTFTHNNYSSNTQVFSGRSSLTFGANAGTSVIDGNSWLLAGVTVPATVFGGREIGNSFATGTTEVLEWADGTAMLGYKQYGQGVAVGFNLHLITSDASPLDAAWSNQIVLNAIGGVGEDSGEVPEPGSLALLGLGLVGLAYAKRRKA